MNKVVYLLAEDLLNIHSVLINETGGSHGVRDRHTLLTLEGLPQQTAFGKELYPSLFTKAALYVRNIIFSHPFVNGNKRTAFGSADAFLQLNGYQITVKDGGVEQFALSILEKHSDLEVIAEWLRANSTRLSKRKT